MSATMSTVYDRPRMISGVCAEIAARAALPSWVPRAVFVIGGLTHAFFAIVLYVVLARILYLSRRGWARPQPVPAAGRADFATVQSSFGRLDERLSNLEAVTLQRETALRRAFRDLERQ